MIDARIEKRGFSVSKRLTAAGVLLVVLVAVLVGCGGGKLPSDGVAKVGGTVITQAQLDARVKEIQAQYGTQAPTKAGDPAAFAVFQNQVLEYLVTLEVVQQKAAELKVTVTAYDIQTQIDTIKAQFNGDQAAFDSALKAQNLTMDSLTKNLQEQTLVTKVIDAVTKNATVTDQQLQDYYNANKSTYMVAETRKIRHILIAPKSADASASTTTTVAGATATYTQAEWDAALATAQKVRALLVNGGDFATLAKQYSDDTGSKDQGGDLGAQPKGAMVPEFDTVAWSLKLNEISQPVKTQYGYHIIQVTQITPASQQTFAQVKETIRTTLLNTEKRKIWDAWLAKTEKDLAVTYKAGMAPTTTTTAAGGSTTTVAPAIQSTPTTAAGSTPTATETTQPATTTSS
jgi:foldase protein PrsA